MNDKNIEKYDFDEFEVEKLPYTMIPNQVIQGLSHKHPVAYAIWSYLQSLPPTWTPNKSHITKTFQVSDRTYHAHMKLLVNFNLVTYVRRRAENGQLGPVVIRVLNGSKFSLTDAKTHTANICIVDFNHTAKKPQCGEPTMVANCAHINTTTIQTQNKINKVKSKPSVRTTEAVESPPPKPTENTEMAEYRETLFPMPAPTKQSGGLSVQTLTEENPHSIPVEMIEDWLTVRKSKRNPVTPTAWKRLNQQLAKCQNPVEAFEIMVSHGWTSLNHTWIDRMTKEEGTKGHFDYDDKSWADSANRSIFN